MELKGVMMSEPKKENQENQSQSQEDKEIDEIFEEIIDKSSGLLGGDGKGTDAEGPDQVEELEEEAEEEGAEPLSPEQVQELIAPPKTVHLSESDKEKLEDPLYQPTLSTPEPCKHCHKETYKVCIDCHGPYCEDDASKLDPRYCKLCLSLEEIKTEETSPVVGENGHTYKDSRSIRPVGESFKRSAQLISEMSDYELSAHIQYCKVQCHATAKLHESWRIKQSMGELEQTERDHQKARRRRALRAVGIRKEGIIIGGPDNKLGKVKSEPNYSKMASALSEEDVKKILEKLGMKK